MSVKQQLHEVLEALSDQDLYAILVYADLVRRRAQDTITVSEVAHVGRGTADLDDAMSRALAAAPVDDEPTTAEEDALAETGLSEFYRGNYVSRGNARALLLDEPRPEPS